VKTLTLILIILGIGVFIYWILPKLKAKTVSALPLPIGSTPTQQLSLEGKALYDEAMKRNVSPETLYESQQYGLAPSKYEKISKYMETGEL